MFVILFVILSTTVVPRGVSGQREGADVVSAEGLPDHAELTEVPAAGRVAA